MLGLDRNAAELAGLITGEEENPSRPFCIAFEHPACLRFRVARRASLPSIIRHSLRSGRCLIPTQPLSYDAVCDHKGVSVDAPHAIRSALRKEVTRGADLSMREAGPPAGGSRHQLHEPADRGHDSTLMPVSLVASRVTIARLPTSMKARKCGALR